MNEKLEKIYYNLPVFLQNLAVGLMGLKLKKERFSKAGDEMLEVLLKTKNFDAENIKAYQDIAFSRIAKHAIETTEFYKEWAVKNKIDPDNITSLEDLKSFPIIEKKFIRENHELFRSNDPHLSKSQIKLHTSGTTGTPLTVYTDKYSRSKHYSFFSRLRAEYGIFNGDKRVTLFGRIIMLADQQRPPFWRYDFSQKNLLMSSYHLNEKNIIHYYEKLKSFNAKEIFSYPSSIYQIAKFIVEHNLEPISLNLVMTTAESLLPKQREIISKAFIAPLVNQYGCTEMAFFCSENIDGIMRFHPEHGVAEIRNSEGLISETGSGELIATGFINYSMPVIRYAVGDAVTITSDVRSNGYQILTSTEGRMDDILFTKEGTPIGRLDPIFKGGAGIKFAQIVQNEDWSIELILVPDTNYSEQHGNDLKDELIKRVGHKIQIKISLVDSIPKEKNGKIKSVICKIKRAN